MVSSCTPFSCHQVPSTGPVCGVYGYICKFTYVNTPHIRRTCVGMGCIAISGERGIAWVVVGGTELLVTQQIIKKANTTLTRFRPEPGFYRIEIFIG